LRAGGDGHRHQGGGKEQILHGLEYLARKFLCKLLCKSGCRREYRPGRTGVLLPEVRDLTIL
jgi:hypothetical protein